MAPRRADRHAPKKPIRRRSKKPTQPITRLRPMKCSVSQARSRPCC
jgi:hypothetical protein